MVISSPAQKTALQSPVCAVCRALQCNSIKLQAAPPLSSCAGRALSILHTPLPPLGAAGGMGCVADSKSATFIWRATNGPPMKDSWASHWLITSWKFNDVHFQRELDKTGHHDFGPFLNEFFQFAKRNQARYWCYSVEHEEGMAHVHTYLELARSIRFSTLKNKVDLFSPGSHIEARRGFRSAAREYSMGWKRGVRKPSSITSGEYGVWRVEHPSKATDPVDDILHMILVDQKSPADVMHAFPRYFLSNSAKVIRMWETHKRRRWIN